jgi:single-stranded-DNA-specific exonuclease
MAEHDWVAPLPVEVPASLADYVGGHPLVARTLVRRGIKAVPAARAFLDPSAYTPAPPTDFPDMARAVARVAHAVREREPICVWGDFDVDGQTATTLLVSLLRDLGARVTYHIPVRATESHGVKVPQLQEVLAEGARLILTCDTGVAAHEAVAYARSQGADVVVTDHHELPPELPAAYAIVNPHRLPAGHALAALPGVGVAYKLAEALYAEFGRPEAVTRHQDLVALGIVADVAEQVDDTRYLLQQGLRALRTTSRLGLQALMKLAHINPAQLNEEHIGFGLGPRLNALGRLSDANVSVEFLTTDDLSRARILASQLESLNARRKMLCDQVFGAAEAQLEQTPSLLEHAALVLAHPTWPPGVIGIVANRLAERYHRPTVLLATPEGAPARGSARSIAGCHITEALAQQQHLLHGFGGHAMAAGMSLDPEDIPEFRRGLSRAVAAQIGAEAPPPTLQIAEYVPLADLSLALVDDLERLAPFGPGNPPLVLATRDLRVARQRTLGRSGRHLAVTVQDAAGTTQEVVWWRWDGAPVPEGRFDLAYTVRANDFRGRRELQVVWEDARLRMPAVSVARPAPPALHLVDHRRAPRPEQALAEVLAAEEVQVWREGPGAVEVAGQDRAGLAPAPALAIWTPPPGPDALQAALEAVSPETVHVFNAPVGLDAPEALLKYIAGLVKYALRHLDGRVSLAILAAKAAQRESVVRLALAWLEARGHITILEEGQEMVEVAAASSPAPAQADQLAAQLSTLLREVAAYRRYFARAQLAVLRASMLGEELEGIRQKPRNRP